MILWGVATFMYNDIFRDELTLWSDNARKAPALHIPHNNLAFAYLRAGRLAEAYDECQKAATSVRMANLANKHRTDIVLAQYYILVKDTEKVLYHTDRALKYFPAFADLHNLKGLVLLEKKDWSSAEREIRKAISLNPDNALFRFHLGLLYLRQRHIDRAVGEAKNALRINPDSWQAYLLMADAFKIRENQKVAEHFLRVSRRGQLEQQDVAGHGLF
jgi:tetratricopeptide (TPR) repeat protein